MVFHTDCAYVLVGKKLKKGKYDSTCGIVDAKTTHDFNKAICEEMAEWCFEEENTETPLYPESRETGETVRTSRGLFYVTNMTNAEMERTRYGLPHQSNGSFAYAICANKVEKADPENPPKTLIKVKKMFRMPFHECFPKIYSLDLKPGKAANKEQAIRLLRENINNGFLDTNVCLEKFEENKIQEIIICPNCGAKTTVQNGFVYCYDCEWEAPIDMLQVITEEEKS